MRFVKNQQGAVSLILVTLMLAVTMSITFSLSLSRLKRTQYSGDQAQATRIKRANLTVADFITFSVYDGDPLSDFYVPGVAGFGDCAINSWAGNMAPLEGLEYCLLYIGQAANPRYPGILPDGDVYEVYTRFVGGEIVQKKEIFIPLPSAPLLPSNLRAWWTFDGGSLADSSGNGNHGTNNGATAVADRGGAYSFDGVDDYIDVGTFDLTGDEVTISVWINADDFDITDARIISKSDSTAASAHYFMLSTINAGGSIRPRIRLKTEGTTSTFISSTGVLTTGIWTHLAIVYDGSFVNLYQDGVLLDSFTKTGVISQNPAISVHIGRNPDGYGPFDGLIDDVRIYDKALTDTEILDIYNATNIY